MMDLTKIEWKPASDKKPWEVKASSDFAEVATSMWRPSPALTKSLQPILPTQRDYMMQLRHELPGHIELSAEHAPSSKVYVPSNSAMCWPRLKLYMRAYVAYDAMLGGDTDAVRAACFDASKLLADHIRQAADGVHNTSGHQSVKVLFTHGEPIRYPVGFAMDEPAYVAFDEMTDRISIAMASYYFAVPA